MTELQGCQRADARGPGATPVLPSNATRAVAVSSEAAEPGANGNPVIAGPAPVTVVAPYPPVALRIIVEEPLFPHCTTVIVWHPDLGATPVAGDQLLVLPGYGGTPGTSRSGRRRPSAGWQPWPRSCRYRARP